MNHQLIFLQCRCGGGAELLGLNISWFLDLNLHFRIKKLPLLKFQQFVQVLSLDLREVLLIDFLTSQIGCFVFRKVTNARSIQATPGGTL